MKNNKHTGIDKNHLNSNGKNMFNATLGINKAFLFSLLLYSISK